MSMIERGPENKVSPRTRKHRILCGYLDCFQEIRKPWRKANNAKKRTLRDHRR